MLYSHEFNFFFKYRNVFTPKMYYSKIYLSYTHISWSVLLKWIFFILSLQNIMLLTRHIMNITMTIRNKHPISIGSQCHSPESSICGGWMSSLLWFPSPRPIIFPPGKGILWEKKSLKDKKFKIFLKVTGWNTFGLAKML